jgi:hypothetical protein
MVLEVLEVRERRKRRRKRRKEEEKEEEREEEREEGHKRREATRLYLISHSDCCSGALYNEVPTDREWIVKASTFPTV